MIGGRWKGSNVRSRAVLTDEWLFVSLLHAASNTAKAADLKFSSSSWVHAIHLMWAEGLLPIFGTGGQSGAVPPVPIPHTAVKRPSADDTVSERGWDNRSPPGIKTPPSREAFSFGVVIIKQTPRFARNRVDPLLTCVGRSTLALAHTQMSQPVQAMTPR